MTTRAVRSDFNGCAVRAFDRVLPRLPGAQAIAYDGAFRGTHINHLTTTHRLPVITPIRYKGEEDKDPKQRGKKPSKRRKRKRSNIPEDTHYGRVTAHHADGTTGEVNVHIVAGLPHALIPNFKGDPIPYPMTRIKPE